MNENNFSHELRAANVLTESQDSFIGSRANYWITKDGLKGEEAHFLLDLGCVMKIGFLRLINTHNADFKDRSTQKFR